MDECPDMPGKRKRNRIVRIIGDSRLGKTIDGRDLGLARRRPALLNALQNCLSQER
ncbi:hypothetical protein GM524_13335, partial [Streptococcus pneumoniae]|nr:hypothetical protein [Streptococcus pneumoniae]